jgi:hypothetical protein
MDMQVLDSSRIHRWVAVMTSMAEDSGFRDIKRKPKPGWQRWHPPPLGRRERLGIRLGVRGKTAWDWLDLLIVPMMLALFAGFFTTFQLLYQTWQEEAREHAVINETARFQQFIEQSRSQEASLQNYLDLITNLLVEHHLGDNNPDDEVTALARAQTLSMLRKLDPEGKRTIVLFLTDAGLLQASPSDSTGGGVISLAGADLKRVNLPNAELELVDFTGANLSDADLSGPTYTVPTYTVPTYTVPT